MTQDEELIRTARELIAARYREDHHHIAAALRTKSGKVFTGVHVEAYVGRITICGEAVAIGAAATAGDTEIDTIVAVNELGQIVSPCGMCRELISDYGPDAKVIIGRDGKAVAVPIGELLPEKYSREEHVESE
ncbi:MAG: cytidine deaminase [Phycisphaerales bacterium]|nr:MAG: cytidine deaminase [Phycisphaerales bacterium]